MGKDTKQQDQLQKEMPSLSSNNNKKKSLRGRVRKLFTGKSRRKNAGTRSIIAEEEISIADAISVANGTKAAKIHNSTNTPSAQQLLRVVILLMDLETRRFELLFLELKHEEACVSDILEQIPHSVTEKSLSTINYKSVCGSDGIERKPDTLLSSFCSETDALVAIPEDQQASDCIPKAQNILRDEKVVGMLRTHGLSIEKWSAKRGEPDVELQISESTGNKSRHRPFYWIIFFVLVGALLYRFYPNARPNWLSMDKRMLPNTWFSNHCQPAMLLKNSCENKILALTSGGKVTLYNEDKTIAWEIQGQIVKDEEEEFLSNELETIAVKLG